MIENVVVAPRHRRHGIGRLILTHIEGLCHGHDCSKMMLMSTDTRTEAHQFFERCGFSAGKKRGFIKYRSQFHRAQIEENAD